MSDAFRSSDDFDEQAHQLYNEGRYDDAVALLREGLSLYPHAVELHIGLAYAQLAREEYAWARRSFERALTLLLEKVEKAKLGRTDRPRRRRSIRPGTDTDVREPGLRSRHVPQEVKDAVSRRDADQCAYVSPAGKRCTERTFLEFPPCPGVCERGTGDGREHLPSLPAPQPI